MNAHVWISFQCATHLISLHRTNLKTDCCIAVVARRNSVIDRLQFESDRSEAVACMEFPRKSRKNSAFVIGGPHSSSAKSTRNEYLRLISTNKLRVKRDDDRQRNPINPITMETRRPHGGSITRIKLPKIGRWTKKKNCQQKKCRLVPVCCQLVTFLLFSECVRKSRIPLRLKSQESQQSSVQREIGREWRSRW